MGAHAGCNGEFSTRGPTAHDRCDGQGPIRGAAESRRDFGSIEGRTGRVARPFFRPAKLRRIRIEVSSAPRVASLTDGFDSGKSFWR